MLPTLAVNKFLNEKRDDLRIYKKKTPEELDYILVHKPPLWNKLRLHQKVSVLIGLIHRKIGFWLDPGCVAGDTLIETDVGQRRIDELVKEGLPIKVWSLTPYGLKIVPASCPFKKGKDMMYEITFNSGRSIRVIGKHFFFSERGWISCAELLVGERLPIFDVCHPQSTEELFPLKYRQDVQHSNYKQINYQDHWNNLLCDEQLQLAEDSDQVFFPLLNEILAHNPLLSHSDDQDTKYKHNYHFCNDRLSKTHSETLEDHNYDCKEFPLNEFDTILNLDHNHISRLTDPISNPVQLGTLNQALESLALSQNVDVDLLSTGYYVSEDKSEQLTDYKKEFQPFPLSTYSLPPFSEVSEGLPSRFSIETVTSIKPIGEQVYYDLHVPRYHNYIAHGLCNHNTGKTLISIVLIRYFKQEKLLKKALILVPNNINLWEWQREILKHSPKSSYVVLHGSTEAKWKKLYDNPKALFTIVTYAGLLRMVCEKVIKKRKKKLDINTKRMKDIANLFECLVMDESTNCANRAKLPFRICRQITNKTKFNFALSGTPFGRDPIPLWAQMFLIDRGESLGKNLGIFRAAFYREVENPWSGFPAYEFDNKKKLLLNKCLAHRSIRYKANAADLPKVINIIKEVNLPLDARLYYAKALENLRAAKGDFKETKNMFLRLRQISSGFLGYADDETGTRAQIEFPNNKKLQLLLSIVQEIYESHKIVIFHDFVFSGSMIERELMRLNIGYVRVYGKTNKKEIPEILNKFDNDKKVRIFIVNSAGAFGINLQKASQYALFYESPVSPIQRKQMEARIVRQESAFNKAFLYDLIVKNTMDEKILGFHKEGKDLWQEILEGKVKL